MNSLAMKNISRSRCNKSEDGCLYLCGYFCFSQVEIEINFETTGITIDMQEIQTVLLLSTYEKSPLFSSGS